MRYLKAAFVAILLSGGVLNAAAGQSCTYGEAGIALENGNVVRGFALMRMASRDGDPRAEAFLRQQDYVLESPVLKTQLELTAANVSRK